jgi:methylglutaconyl-CoA hydratase
MSLLTNTDSQGIATLTLNRPHLHNAFDDELIELLTLQLQELEADSTVRVILLTANGKNFSAGADLNWMQRIARYSLEENINDATHLALLMKTLREITKPTIALVHGATYGGGVGLVACCDIAIATTNAQFCLSEVKLGLVPAIISPYVIEAIGERAARRYFLTAETFDAHQAERLGLVHMIVEEDKLVTSAHELAKTLCNNSPAAITAAKQLISEISLYTVDEDVLHITTQCIAKRRMSPEGQEGISAFLEKRQPKWIKNDDVV